MAIRERVSLFNRYSKDIVETVEAFKTYYIIMEGTNTEPIYFRLLEKRLSELRIRNNIRIVYLDRTSNDRGSNSPKQLFNFLLDFKANKNDSNAVYCMVFDRDSYKNHRNPEQSYLDFVQKANKTDIKMIVTSPCFEIWLLLHKKNAFKDYIKPNQDEIFKNERISPHYTYISKMISDIFGFNPKSDIPDWFLYNLDNALKQSSSITSSIEEMAYKIGENVGNFIEDLKADHRNI